MSDAEVETKAVVSKNETMLFMDFPELKEGEITSLKIDINKILPGEKIRFTYNNLEYYIILEQRAKLSRHRAMAVTT